MKHEIGKKVRVIDGSSLTTMEDKMVFCIYEPFKNNYLTVVSINNDKRYYPFSSMIDPRLNEHYYLQDLIIYSDKTKECYRISSDHVSPEPSKEKEVYVSPENLFKIKYKITDERVSIVDFEGLKLSEIRKIYGDQTVKEYQAGIHCVLSETSPAFYCYGVAYIINKGGTYSKKNFDVFVEHCTKASLRLKNIIKNIEHEISF